MVRQLSAALKQIEIQQQQQFQSVEPQNEPLTNDHQEAQTVQEEACYTGQVQQYQQDASQPEVYANHQEQDSIPQQPQFEEESQPYDDNSQPQSSQDGESQESVEPQNELKSTDSYVDTSNSAAVNDSELSSDYSQSNSNAEPTTNGDSRISESDSNLESQKEPQLPEIKQPPVILVDENAVDNRISDKENVMNNIKEEQEDDDEVEVLPSDTLKALQMSEEDWAKLSKNQRRKLKKKFRNKIKRKERDEIEKRKQQQLLKIQELEKEEEVKVEDDEDRMDIDEEDEPEEEREKKRQLEELQKKAAAAKKKQQSADEVEIEYVKSPNLLTVFTNFFFSRRYVPEQIAKDDVYLQFLKVFDKFSAVPPDEASRLEEERLAAEISSRQDHRAKMLELKKPVELELKDDDEKVPEGMEKLSKRKMKQLTRMSVADLKQRVLHPELVEMHDVTGRDPVLLLHLKSTRNTVPVPRHWCYKRKYLQGKRGFEKPPFKLPEFIRRTGIQEMREAIQEKEDAKSLKNKMREKIRPKMGKIDIDYQKLHDAFFKWQTKPKLTIHGDLYYEGKELETRLKDKKPGDLSTELRSSLGMPTGPNAHKCPPPWLIAMQRYGPPPSYPNIKIPGLNAPIPEGCCFGYHAGGWGKPPVDEYGRPLYGDVFGVTSSSKEINMPEEEVDRNRWGEMEDNESEAEESEEEEEDETTGAVMENGDDSGLVTPAANVEGLITPSGISTGLPSGMETPDMIELRKRKQQIEAEMERYVLGL